MKKINCIIVIIILFISPNLLAENLCGDLNVMAESSDGPYDYNSGHRRIRQIEKHHFNKNVENLVSGMTGKIGSDISFLLRYVPNHHRALLSMSNLGLREKRQKVDGAAYSVLCFFDRAVRFKPDDPVVRSLFSNHLIQIGQLDLAIEQLEIASRLQPDNPMSNYNLGLLYFKKKDYDQALKYAKKAYSHDFPLPGLKNKLIKVGKW